MGFGYMTHEKMRGGSIILVILLVSVFLSGCSLFPETEKNTEHQENTTNNNDPNQVETITITASERSFFSETAKLFLTAETPEEIALLKERTRPDQKKYLDGRNKPILAFAPEYIAIEDIVVFPITKANVTLLFSDGNDETEAIIHFVKLSGVWYLDLSDADDLKYASIIGVTNFDEIHELISNFFTAIQSGSIDDALSYVYEPDRSGYGPILAETQLSSSTISDLKIASANENSAIVSFMLGDGETAIQSMLPLIKENGNWFITTSQRVVLT